jgi:hypothetical protein
VQGNMIPQAVSTTLHGLANIQAVAGLGFAVPIRVQTALYKALVQQASAMDAQAVANSAWSLGKLAWAPPAKVMAGLFAAIVRMHGDMKPQGVSNTLHGLASIRALADLKVAVPARVQAALRNALVREASGMDEQAVANCIWAMGTLRWHIDQRVQHALEAALARGSDWTAQHLSNTLLGLANAAAPLRAEAMAQLLGLVHAKLMPDGGNQQAFVNSLHALAVLSVLGVHIDDQTVLRLAQRVFRMPLLAVQHRQVRLAVLERGRRVGFWPATYDDGPMS